MQSTEVSLQWLANQIGIPTKRGEKLIREYIDVHKWFVNEKIPFEVSFEQAVYSWYETVWLPMERAIDDSGLFYISEKSGIPAIDIIEWVSDEHFVANMKATAENMKYVTYTEVCDAIIWENVKGFWFFKAWKWLTSR